MKYINLLVTLLAVIFYMPGFAQAAESPAPKLTLISNVNIFDGKNEKLHKNMHVLVKGNQIETISSEPLAVIQTDNVTIINGGGRSLMPRLIDAHVHLSRRGVDSKPSAHS
jgi:imidazolonepropionase-like amidohydrolase